MVYPQSGHEFLTMGVLPQFDCDNLETNCSTTPEFQKRSREDALKWKAAMATSACVVEIESCPGEGWEHLAPLGTQDLTREHDSSPKTGARDVVHDDDEACNENETMNGLSQWSGSDYQSSLGDETDHHESDSQRFVRVPAPSEATNSIPAEPVTPTARADVAHEQTPIGQVQSSVGIRDSEELRFTRSWSI